MIKNITFLGFSSQYEQILLFRKISGAYEIDSIQITELVYSCDRALTIKFKANNNCYVLQSPNTIVHTICTNFKIEEFVKPSIEFEENNNIINITMLFNRIEKMCFQVNEVSIIKIKS